MFSKLVHAIVMTLFAIALPLVARGETMTVTEFLSGKSNLHDSTCQAPDEGLLRNLSFELPVSPANAEPFPGNSLQFDFVEMPSARPTPTSLNRLPTAFVILDAAAAGDYVREIVCEPDTTVSIALKTQVYPQPVDFKDAIIAIHRVTRCVSDDLAAKAEEQILRVDWDAKSNNPTEKSDYHLQPCDRLIVTLPSSTETEPQPTRSIAFDPEQPDFGFDMNAVEANPPKSPKEMPALKPSTVKFDVTVVEDVGDNFAEFDELKSRMPFMLADTATMQGTLRILEKNNLVRRVSSPQLMVVAGEKARLVIGSEMPGEEQPWQGIKAEMGARELGGGLAVEFQLENTEGRDTNMVQTSLIVPHGQTVVLKTGSQVMQASANEDTTGNNAKRAVYVVLTPEVVKTR